MLILHICKSRYPDDDNRNVLFLFDTFCSAIHTLLYVRITYVFIYQSGFFLSQKVT